MTESSYQFTSNWFDIKSVKGVWDTLIPQFNPTKFLEIGSFEGASACYIIEKIAAQKNIELHCIDSWRGGSEHQRDGNYETNMSDVETRFHHNVQLAMKKVKYDVNLSIHKGLSDEILCNLLTQTKGSYFDFIYVDGSHEAPDVLLDALLSFKLLKINGVIAFDDYLWQENPDSTPDVLHSPKIAIDAFTNIYCQKLRIFSAPLWQLYIKKISD